MRKEIHIEFYRLSNIDENRLKLKKKDEIMRVNTET